MTTKNLLVTAIDDGTVIDHIPAGQAIALIRLFQLDQGGYQLMIGVNLPSKTMQRKDLIKITNIRLSEKQAHEIAVFAPEATINIIEHGEISKKINIIAATSSEGTLSCPNSRCITHSEAIKSLFTISHHQQQIYFTCQYCENIYSRDRISAL